jgi:hypothetical protein
MPKAKCLSTKKAKYQANPEPTWELAILDAEDEINRLRRSIEMFKHNLHVGIPFPRKTATHN